MISLSVNDLGGRADLLRPWIMKHLGVRFLHVPSPQHFHFSLPCKLPTSKFPLTQRDNSSCELRNPVCRLPFETFSCQTIFFKNRPPDADYSTEFAKSKSGLSPAIHNPQDFHGTRGPRECTSLIGDAQIQPFSK